MFRRKVDENLISTTFWTNSIWFIILWVLSVVELIIIFVKAKDKKLTFALYCAVIAMIFLYESVICFVLKSYEYYPKFAHNSYDEIMLGNISSQYSVAATAILIAVLNLKNYWYVIFSCAYAIIETIFLTLGIYKQNWYDTWMTAIGTIILFWIVNKMYRYSKAGLKPLPRYIFLTLSLFTLYVNSIYIPRLIGITTFVNPFTSDQLMGASLVAVVDFTIMSNVFMFIYFYKPKWQYSALIILVIYFMNYMATKFGFLYIMQGWFWAYKTYCMAIMYLYIYILDKCYYRW